MFRWPFGLPGYLLLWYLGHLSGKWVVFWKDGLIPSLRWIWYWIYLLESSLAWQRETWVLVPILLLASYVTLNKPLVPSAWVFPFVKLEVWSLSFRVPLGMIIVFWTVNCLAQIGRPTSIDYNINFRANLEPIYLLSGRVGKRKI